jgi:hypothetical protein
MQKWYAVLAILVLSLAEVQAETHVVNPIQSACTSPCDNWGCCCGMSSVEINLSSISIRNCFSQGVYCGNERHSAAWIYEIPELPEGSSISTMAFAGNRSGSYGSGYLYLRWVSSSQLSATTITETVSYSDAEFSINWPSSSSYSFIIPSSMHEAGQSGYVMVVASASNESTMNLHNSGQYGARMFMLVEEEEICVGDFNSNEQLDVDDVLSVNNAYGTFNSTCDFDGNSYIDVDDNLILINFYGDCE